MKNNLMNEIVELRTELHKLKAAIGASDDKQQHTVPKRGRKPLGFQLTKPTAKGCVLSGKRWTIEEVAEKIRSTAFKGVMKGTQKGATIPGMVMNSFSRRRRYLDLQALSGWLAFDIDKLHLKYPHVPVATSTAYIRERLARHPKIHLAFVSQSGNGVKAVGYFGKPSVSIVDLNAGNTAAKDRVKRYYTKQVNSLRENLGLYKNVVFDMSQATPTQVLYVSYDPELIFKPR